jgi:pimeloyl-ACP methyl ester carboxylesterase
MPYITVDETRLAYDQSGAGVPLIMIHGAAQDSTSWRYNTASFSQRFEVFAIDLPGHGKSALPRSGPITDVRDYARAVHGLIEALGLDRPVVMGHSLSGSVVLRLALDHPEAVRAVVNVDGAARTANAATNYRAGVIDLVDINPTDWLQTTFLSLTGRDTPVERKREISVDARRIIPEVGVGDVRAYTSSDFLDELGSLQCPVVSIVGEDDWSCSPALVRETHELITAPTQYHVLERVGHFPHTERPELFDAEVDRMLRALGI